jgi:mannose-6-phosphate isomerase-like protein (cupin superfamily)
MDHYVGDIKTATLENTDYRRVLFTSNGRRSQLVLMSLNRREEIGEEIHKTTDQFIKIESGTVEIRLRDTKFIGTSGYAVVIPADTLHNIINIGETTAKLYTIYTPAEHPEGTVEKTKKIENNQTGGGKKYKIDNKIWLNMSQ